VLLNAATGAPVLPDGTLASRYSDAGKGRWNLDLGGVDPVLTLLGRHEDAVVSVDLPRFDVGETEDGGVIRRGMGVIRLGGRVVTTVFDLLLAGAGGAHRGAAGRPGGSAIKPRNLPSSPSRLHRG